LASDIEGAYDALHDLPTARYQRVTGKFAMDGDCDVTTGVSNFGEFPFHWENHKVQNISTHAYGEVGVDCTTPQGSLNRFGIRTAEFVPTVWELIPYSFVADYFSNIGEALAAATFPVSELKWSGMTTKNNVVSKRYYTLSIPGVKANTSQFKDANGGCSSSSAERTVLKRSTAIFGGTRVLRIQFKVPGLSLKWLNLAALLR
jgi:hypothetical protein